MSSKIRFAYGESNFEKVIQKQAFFVDKTPYLEKLEDFANDRAAFLRPRRMGKSLFVSMLEYYYGQEHKDKFEQLFSKLYIGQHPTPLANTYAVLKMDFSGIDTSTEERAYQGFLTTIKLHITEFNKSYHYFDAEQFAIIQAQDNPELVMKAFFSHYRGEKIYLIIDEYDHFTNELLIQDLGQFQRAVNKNGYVRKFYETLKVATQQAIIDRVFITGVSPITLDALTSGFNIISHLTTERLFHDMMGFTEEQVSEVLYTVLEDKSRHAEIMDDLRIWYNGYRFHKKSTHSLYNSDMVLYFLMHFQRYQEYPDYMLDPNIAPDHSKLRMMFEIQNPQSNYALLEKILAKKEVTGELVLQFSFEQGFSNNQFISFLYYMGYLTIGGEADYELIFKIPNLVIQELYWEYFAYLLTQRENLPATEDNIREAVRQLTRGNLDPFFSLVQEVLQILSNRDYQAFDEKYIKMLIIAYVLVAGAYYAPVSEREVNNDGYVDLLLLSPPNKNVEREYFFEIKYIKKSEASEAHIAEVRKEAEAQARKYLQDQHLAHKKNLYAYTILAVKDVLRVEPLVFP